MYRVANVIHHDFEMAFEDFEDRKAWPEHWPIDSKVDFKGEYASQSPVGNMHVATRGGGANGTARYLALRGVNSDQFYAEATPRWYRPRQALDLRDTRASGVAQSSHAAHGQSRLFSLSLPRRLLRTDAHVLRLVRETTVARRRGVDVERD